MFILTLVAPQFTREIFDQLLSQFDLAVGLNMVCDNEKFSDEVRVCGLENVLFNDEYFKHCVYDSPLAMQMRTYVDVSEFSK